MIGGLVLGFGAGYLVGILMVALLRAADDGCDCQVPTLAAGTWLVGVDEHGELVRCEPHACMEAAFRRLEEAMREGEA